MLIRTAIFATLALTASANNAEPMHPWEVRSNLLQPVDAGKADLNELSASNVVPAVDLRLPTRFERVYRLSDVLRRGTNWNIPADLSNGSREHDGFVRFSGGVAAVFQFSRYTSTAQGRVSEIPEGTIFRLDLKPPSPSDVFYSTPGAASYNTVSLDAGAAVRDLRTVATTQSEREAAASDTRLQDQSSHSLWTDELYRGRTLTDLMDQTARIARR